MGSGIGGRGLTEGQDGGGCNSKELTQVNNTE